MDELVKSFKHLIRDILIYFLCGFIFLGNLLLVDYIIFDGFYLKEIRIYPYWEYFLILLSYFFGHLIFGFMYITFEYTSIENKLKKLLFGNSFTINDLDAIEIYKYNIGIFEYFVDRHTQLYLFRWNAAGTCLLIFLTNSIYISIYRGYPILLLVLFCSLIGFLILYVLELRTEKDCCKLIDDIKATIHAQNQV